MHHRIDRTKRSLLQGIYWLSLIMAVAQVMLILTSWLLTAAMPDMPYHSLLSASGIRWLFNNFSVLLGTPLLVDIILVFVAVGAVQSSGVVQSVRQWITTRPREISSQQKFALTAAWGLLVLEVIVVLLLTFLPHAVLLSITGTLFPSSFSRFLIPILTFMMTSVSVFYAILGGKCHNVYDVGQCLAHAGGWLLPVLILYIFTALLYFSCLYVFF